MGIGGGDCNIQRCKALLQVDKLFLRLRFFLALELGTSGLVVGFPASSLRVMLALGGGHYI